MKFILIRGSTYDEDITVTNKDGTPYNLTGCTVYFTIKKVEDSLKDDDVAVVQKIITDHVNAVGGISHLSLSESDTTQNPGEYYFDFKIKSPSGSIQNTHRKIVTIEHNVTQS